MNEQEFDNLIDCKFPYGDSDECTRLIEVGHSISLEASFMVLHELCRPPKGAIVSKAQLASLVEEWSEKNMDHPLASPLALCAKKMINGDLNSVEDGIKLANLVSEYPGQYSALNIVYFSCDDEHGLFEKRYEEIRDRWH